MNANTLLLFLVASVGQGVPSGRQESPEVERGAARREPGFATRSAGEKAEAARERARRLDLIKRAADAYEIYVGPDGKTKLTLRQEPLLHWSNAVRYSLDGATFIWTEEGRPQVAASIFSSTNRRGFRTLDHEFQSLCTGPLIARRDKGPVWFPAEGGALKLFPGAPTPSERAAFRLTQMRRLAGEFTAIGFNMPKTDHWRLRLLPQPLYRYGGEDDDLIDGALFVFAHGTDPDVIVLLEARRHREGDKWHYSLARMCGLPVEVRHEDRVVWEVPLCPPTDTPDPRGSYITFANRPIKK